MSKKAKKWSPVSIVLVGLSLLGSWIFLNRKESTSKLARFHGRNVIDFIHSYFYFKWQTIYLRPVKYVLEHPHLFPRRMYRSAGERLMQTHHSKVITTATAKKLVDVKEPIAVKNPEQVIPFEQARDIILENSDHLAVTDCACRQLSEHPCEPIDVCFVLGEPFVDFVVEHKTGNTRRVDSGEALAILEREHERGRVHTAWFKDVAGDRLYSICNCCSCCCLGLRAVSLGFGVVASSGYTAQVDEDTCTLCGSCVEACQFKAVEMDDSIIINSSKCKGCGVCIEGCPSDAIALKEDASKPAPLMLP